LGVYRRLANPARGLGGRLWPGKDAGVTGGVVTTGVGAAGGTYLGRGSGCRRGYILSIGGSIVELGPEGGGMCAVG
jgi:hypothetical protein